MTSMIVTTNRETRGISDRYLERDGRWENGEASIRHGILSKRRSQRRRRAAQTCGCPSAGAASCEGVWQCDPSERIQATGTWARRGGPDTLESPVERLGRISVAQIVRADILVSSVDKDKPITDAPACSRCHAAASVHLRSNRNLATIRRPVPSGEQSI